MEKSLFRYIWKYSKRDQLVLLAVTVLTFPVLYISLELPKRIINDAISGTGATVVLLGVELSQVQFLMVLCLGFLLAVLVNGLLKMRLNTMKGVLAERLLRRFRYQLLTRAMRFPKSFFRTTSQGELVSMVTSEAEPMGGLMGDMISQPVFQAGQMLTILVFLFAQSFWFGVASIALIPLQAWLIPRLQRQINQLNKSRIQEVRQLASDIGESSAGVSEIRINGGLRHRMSLFSNRLGNLFSIRFDIYRKKFFMKFLNNFINQLTPFFFYSVGGYLAITGEITVGALVAALAAYKDLSSPWKELLTYYNVTQDMALRWETVTERFSASPIVEDARFDTPEEGKVSLAGDIEISDVTIRDDDGYVVLEDINLTIPAGASIAIQSNNETAASAFGDLLIREVVPHRGSIRIAGRDLNTLPQCVISRGIGYTRQGAHIFSGTIGDNIMMPFKQQPRLNAQEEAEVSLWRKEAILSGNSDDPFDVDWVAPDVGGFGTREEIYDWWFELVEALGGGDVLVRRALRSRHAPGTMPELESAIVALRPEIERRLDEAGLSDVVHRFHPDRFNDVSPLGINLLFAHATRILKQEELAKDPNFMQMLRDTGLVTEIAQMSSHLVDGLTSTFGTDGTQHPLFRRLNMDDDLYHHLAKVVAERRKVGDAGLAEEDLALILTVPFALSAEQFGPIFSDELKQRILQIRRDNSAQMVAGLNGLFVQFDQQRYIPVLTVLGNALYGRISNLAGSREEMIEDVVVEILREKGLRRLVAQSIHGLETTQGAENLPSVFRERAAFIRAGIHRPDILVLDRGLAGKDLDAQAATQNRLTQLMPDVTKIFIDNQFDDPARFDLFVEIKDGRIDGKASTAASDDMTGRQDLDRKLKMVAQADLFTDLSIKQQRLLAFGSQWYKAKAGQAIFSQGEEADAAYLCVEGLAALYWPMPDEEDRLITEVSPGRLIGDLNVIVQRPRQVNLIALEDSKFLRIGHRELMAVIENDAQVASTLLRAVSGHLTNVSDILRQTRQYALERGIDFAEFEPET